MENLAILLVALNLNFAFEILDPAVAEIFLFPKDMLANSKIAVEVEASVLVSVKCILDFNAL
jgi:hypothetical protein